MTFALSAVLSVLSLIVGGAAIGGETWEPRTGRWYRRVTLRGWVTICCLILTVMAGIARDLAAEQESHKEHIENERKNNVLVRLLREAKNEATALSNQLDKTRERLEKATHDNEQQMRSHIENRIDDIGRSKSLVLSQEWTTIGDMYASSFGSSELTLSGFSCDVMFRTKAVWVPEESEGQADRRPEDLSIAGPARALHGEPKLFTVDGDLQEVHELVGRMAKDPLELWKVKVTVELSANTRCAGAYSFSGDLW